MRNPSREKHAARTPRVQRPIIRSIGSLPWRVFSSVASIPPSMLSFVIHSPKRPGIVAIAAANSAYQVYLDTLSNPRWQALAALRAQSQHLLWASTGSKDPDDSDIKYVEALIGPGKVTALPMETLVGYREYGGPRPRLHEAIDRVDAVRRQLAVLGVDIEAVEHALERNGLQKLNEAYDRLIERIDQCPQSSFDEARRGG